MARFHIKKDGEPGVCRAEEGACPLGGEHFDTPDQAREAYESDMRDLDFLRGQNKALNDSATMEKKEFFTPGNAGNYTLIDTTTGTVFGAHSIVMEAPEEDEFYDDVEAYLEDEAYRPAPIQEVSDLSSYRNPIIVEPDTGTVVGIDQNASNLYAIDHSKEMVDFDEVLESHAAAEEAATQQGFRLWG